MHNVKHSADVSILLLLGNPHLETPNHRPVPEVAEIYKNDRDRFNQTVREFTQMYAM